MTFNSDGSVEYTDFSTQISFCFAPGNGKEVEELIDSQDSDVIVLSGRYRTREEVLTTIKSPSILHGKKSTIRWFQRKLAKAVAGFFMTLITAWGRIVFFVTTALSLELNGRVLPNRRRNQNERE